jgi:hypothetical protein
MSQIRTVVAHLAGLADRDAWEAAVQEIEGTHDH